MLSASSDRAPPTRSHCGSGLVHLPFWSASLGLTLLPAPTCSLIPVFRSHLHTSVYWSCSKPMIVTPSLSIWACPTGLLLHPAHQLSIVTSLVTSQSFNPLPCPRANWTPTPWRCTSCISCPLHASLLLSSTPVPPHDPIRITISAWVHLPFLFSPSRAAPTPFFITHLFSSSLA